LHVAGRVGGSSAERADSSPVASVRTLLVGIVARADIDLRENEKKKPSEGERRRRRPESTAR
jgi:hypothetical protein